MEQDIEKRVNEFKDFLKETYPNIFETFRKGEESFLLDFNKIVRWDFEWGEFILDNPIESIEAIALAIETVLDNKKTLIPRFENIPKSIMIKDRRSTHIDKLLVFEGVIRQTSVVLPRVSSSIYECPQCGNLISIQQREAVIKQPSICGCGRKGKFRLKKETMIDTQRLILEELPEKIFTKEHPQRCNILLQNDLTNSDMASYCLPGTQVKITGILKKIQISAKVGGKLVDADFIVEANHVEVLDKQEILKITKEDEKEMEALLKETDYFNKLVKSMAPEIYGMELMKEGLVYHIPGGNKIVHGQKKRIGSISLLVVTDPAVSKSSSMQSLMEIAPKVVYADCTGLSGPGLSAAAIRDEFIGGFVLEAGAAVLASGGSLILDELDKMDEEARKTLHVIMSEQKVVKHVANLHVEMKAECGVIGLCNPKKGRFDSYAGEFTNQIDMPPSLISRFDIPILIQDIPEEEKDSNIADSILNFRERETEAVIDKHLLKKIFFKAKGYYPKLNKSARDIIKKYYVDLRGKYKQEQKLMITPRQFETLIKITEASAKLRFSNEANSNDAKRAVSFLDKCFLAARVYDEGIGSIDEEGVGYSKKDKVKTILQAMDELHEKMNIIPIQTLLENVAFIEKYEFEDIIETLRKNGDLFEPKPGFLKKI